MPSSPLRLQVIDRVVDVLRGIQEGDDYFFSPRQVEKGFIAEPSGYPVYEVTSESGGEIEMHTDSQYAESFYIAIRGTVHAQGDITTPLERCLRDIRKAVEDDFASGAAAGSLVFLATSIMLDTPPEIEYGFEGQGVYGYFTQRVRVTVSGTFGEI